MSVFDWSTTAGSNGNSDATINFQENQAPSTVNDSARALMSRVAYWVKMLSGNNTQGGTSNAYTITTGESLSAYGANMRFTWTPNADSTGATTLNVDAIGAKKVYLPTGVQAGSGDIESNSVYDVVYQTALDSAAGGFKIVGGDAGYAALTLATAALPSSSYTAADVLTKIKTVDGAGSGLDADTLDGVQASAFLQAANNLSDLAGAGTARTNLGLGTMATQVKSSVDITGGTIAGVAQTGGTSTAAAGAGTTSTGTLVLADANTDLGTLSGNITIPASIFSARDVMVGNVAGATRTITRGAGLIMYVNGTDSASCTVSTRGVFGIRFGGSSVCYVTGDVS